MSGHFGSGLQRVSEQIPDAAAEGERAMSSAQKNVFRDQQASRRLTI